jgi:hypothetical protein
MAMKLKTSTPAANKPARINMRLMTRRASTARLYPLARVFVNVG